MVSACIDMNTDSPHERTASPRPHRSRSRMRRSPSRRRHAQVARAKAVAENLNFYYGANQALKNINLPIPERQVTALIGPSGCGKSTFLRCFNRMHDLQPDTRYEGSIMLHPGQREPRRHGRRPDRSAHAHRHGVPEAESVPEDRSSRTSRTACDCAACSNRADAGERVEKALRGAAIWDEVKDRLQRFGAGAVRRPEAAPVHRARAGDRAGDPAVRRADVGARPDRDREDRGADHRRCASSVTILIVTHNMQQAARVSDFTAFMYLGELVEVDATSQDLHEPVARRRPKTTSPAVTVDIAPVTAMTVSAPPEPELGPVHGRADRYAHE